MRCRLRAASRELAPQGALSAFPCIPDNLPCVPSRHRLFPPNFLFFEMVEGNAGLLLFEGLEYLLRRLFTLRALRCLSVSIHRASRCQNSASMRLKAKVLPSRAPREPTHHEHHANLLTTCGLLVDWRHNNCQSRLLSSLLAWENRGCASRPFCCPHSLSFRLKIVGLRQPLKYFLYRDLSRSVAQFSESTDTLHEISLRAYPTKL